MKSEISNFKSLGPRLILGLALILSTAFSCWSARAAEVVTATNAPGAQPPPNPGRLKQEVRVVVQTNVPLSTLTNAAAGEKSTQLKVTWAGWDGLHTEISQKTPIGDPLADLRHRLHGTNVDRVFHLEELKLSGKIGMKVAVDAAGFLTSSQLTGFNDGIELRRLRLYAKGDCLLLIPFAYELEIGYVPNSFYIENSYLLFPNLGIFGDLKMGQFQTPMSLEGVTSSRDLTFMEPAAPIQALAPGVDAGMQLNRVIFNQRMTWAFGLFAPGVGQDYGDASQDFARAIMRFTGLPMYHVNPDDPYDQHVFHLGLSGNILYSGNSTVHYQSRPESHIAPYVVNTEDIAADSAVVADAEIAWVDGPFSVQGEFLHSWVRESNLGQLDFNGFYASASYFLTGETRPYRRETGDFGRVIPKKNFDWGHGGWGAWEVAARLSYVDLNSENINGGRLGMLMTGINWYMHPHVKWRLNIGCGRVSSHNPDGNIFLAETRFEFDF